MRILERFVGRELSWIFEKKMDRVHGRAYLLSKFCPDHGDSVLTFTV